MKTARAPGSRIDALKTPVERAEAAGRDTITAAAPDGFVLRMMEAGEVDRLREIDGLCDELLVEAGHREVAADARPLPHDYAAFLSRHEVFVAARDTDGTAVGFAAATDIGELYWLTQIAVLPRDGRKGVGAALLEAVVGRAGWFFHRAVGLSTYLDVPFNAPFFARHGFLSVAADDLSPALAARLAAEAPAGACLKDRAVMVRWL